MRTRIYFLLTFTFFTTLLSVLSCNDCGPFKDRFKLKGLNWSTQEVVYTDTAIYKLQVFPITNDSVIYDRYAIQILPDVEYYFAQHMDHLNFSLINSAYACSPAPAITEERIDSIVIVSSKNFDATHLAGTNLAALFDVIIFDEANYIYEEKYPLVDYLLTKPDVPNQLILILNSKPGQTEEFQFTIKYYQKGIDIDYLEYVTDPVVIMRE